MASEQSAETSVTITLPEDVSDWLDARAASEGIDRDALLAQLIAAYRLTVDPDDSDAADIASILTHVPDENEIRAETIEEIEKRTEALESTFVALVEDVRNRVVQVKREGDAKAPKDHEHEELAAGLESIDEDVETLRTTVATVADSVDRLETRFDDGFENYESVLTELVDSIDALDERATKLATVVVDLRSTVGTLKRDDAERQQLGAILDTANQHGIRTANCDSCGTKVDLALVRTPSCPHCDSMFARVEPKRGLFGSHTLFTDDRPALESAEEQSARSPDVDELFAERVHPSNAPNREDDGGDGQ